jgi:hypothetical protein
MEIGQLPRVCFYCGSESAMTTEVSLPFTPTGRRFFVQPKDSHDIHLVGHGGWFLAPVVPFVILRNLLVTRRISLQLPLCEKHRETATVYHPLMRVAALFMGLLGIAFAVLACLSFSRAVRAGINPMEQFGIYWVYAGIGFASILVALFIRARLHDGFLYLVSVADDAFILGGVPRDVAEKVSRQEHPAECPSPTSGS